MKVVHVLKRIETIDQDIKDLKKLEKTIARDKSFSTPIYMSIEQQINILVSERVKLFELQISNPPENLAKAIEGEETEELKPLLKKKPQKKSSKRAKKNDSESGKGSNNRKGSAVVSTSNDDDDDDLPFRMLTQDQIDNKINNIKKEEPVAVETAEEKEPGEVKDEAVKLLDVALTKGSINKKDVVKEKKRVRFFKDNIPGGEY